MESKALMAMSSSLNRLLRRGVHFVQLQTPHRPGGVGQPLMGPGDAARQQEAGNDGQDEDHEARHRGKD
jgi:hypothetical protein